MQEPGQAADRTEPKTGDAAYVEISCVDKTLSLNNFTNSTRQDILYNMYQKKIWERRAILITVKMCIRDI